MGNCCGGDESKRPAGVTVSGNQPRAFSGTGHKLGSSSENLSASSGRSNFAATTPAEKIVVNPNISDEERDRARLERLAAAEERIKAKGGDPNPKKKKEVAKGLKGPNSEPLMRW